MFDTSHELSMDGLTTVQRLMRLCIECRAVFARSEDACPSCGSPSSLPFLDRRPLLLSAAALDAVVTLIDAAVWQMPDDATSDGFCFIVCIVLPFLTELLRDSERAAELRANGEHGAYRLTSVSGDEMTSMMRNLVLVHAAGATTRPRGGLLMTKKNHRDIAAEITATIVARLAAGVAPWVRPWSTPGRSAVLPSNAATGKRYRGVNVLLLWAATSEAGYAHSCWLTFKQAQGLGGHVRKDERGTQIVYWRPVERTEENAAGATETHVIWFCVVHTVFNVEQCEGLEEEDPEPPVVTEAGAAERLAEARGARVLWSGSRAYYSTRTDQIRMPLRERFDSDAACEGTLLHELTHWTGHRSRLNRQFGKRFGDDAYAFEELVAELGSAFLCAELGVDNQLQHAEYLGHWARVLGSDRYAIFTASRLGLEASESLVG